LTETETETVVAHFTSQQYAALRLWFWTFDLKRLYQSLRICVSPFWNQFL